MCSDWVHSSPLSAIAVICLLLLSSVQCAGAGEPESAELSSEAPKLYSPFDEPKPKIPAEILSDIRLDTKVTISVKSKNMKDLFWEIRKRTGVNIVAAKDLSGERAIVFCHDKPLRDVMTEISALYGYYWLAKGQKGAWTYELFEDMIHAKRRDQVRDSQEAAQVDALLDCIDQATRAIKSDAALEQLRRTNPRLHLTVADPGKRELLNLINLMDKPTIRGFLNDVGIAWDFPDMSAEMQSGVLKAINGEYGVREGAGYEPLTADRMQKAYVRFKRWRMNLFTPPHVMLVVSVPAKEDGTGGGRRMCMWTDYDEGEPDLLSMPEQPAGRVIGDPLPSDVKITVEKKHEVFNYGAILVQDVLEAVARQAKLNVVADYYFQETELPACSDEPLDKLVSEVCLKMDYTCQVEKDTLRFKFNKWYLQPLPEEPPSALQELWWRKVKETGGLSLDDLLDIACLRDKQTFWAGFRFIPQAQQARLFPRTARMVRMLGSALEDEACTPAGLPVSKLDADQFSRIADWAGVMGIKETLEGLLKCTIKIKKSGDPVNSLQFMLVLPDGTPRGVPLNARLERLDEKERRTLAAGKGGRAGIG